MKMILNFHKSIHLVSLSFLPNCSHFFSFSENSLSFLSVWCFLVCPSVVCFVGDWGKKERHISDSVL